MASALETPWSMLWGRISVPLLGFTSRHQVSVSEADVSLAKDVMLTATGMDGQATVQENWQHHPVDQDILGLVNALNQVPGVVTFASCSGHRWRYARGSLALGSGAYVRFGAPLRFAAALEDALYRLSVSSMPLNHAWEFFGTFGVDRQLRFNLHTSPASSILIRRGLLDDFARLERIIECMCAIGSPQNDDIESKGYQHDEA